MSKYRIYVDEVGNPDIGSSENFNNRFLSLTGVVIELSHVEKEIFPEIENLKRKFFSSHPDDPVIFHRKDIMNARPPFDNLSDPAIRERFDDALIELLQNWNYVVISVCLDKKKHKDTYQTWRYDPYHYCLKVLQVIQSKYYQRDGIIYGRKLL